MPTGSIDFYFSQEYLGSALLANGSASIAIPTAVSATLPSSSFTIEAACRGDAHYASAPYRAIYTVNEPILPTTTVLAVNSRSLLTSQTLHLTAQVNCATGTPTGSASFHDGKTYLG